MTGDYVTTEEVTAELEQLREENAQLRAELERLRPKPAKSTSK